MIKLGVGLVFLDNFVINKKIFQKNVDFPWPDFDDAAYEEAARKRAYAAIEKFRS